MQCYEICRIHTSEATAMKLVLRVYSIVKCDRVILEEIRIGIWKHRLLVLVCEHLFIEFGFNSLWNNAFKKK